MCVTFDLEDALSRFPLPEGVADETLNRGQCAQALGVSENMITRYMDQGMPVLSRGSNGQAYEFLASECYAWKLWRDDDQRLKREAGERTAQQMAMLFRNDEDADPNDHVLSASQIAEEADADYKRSRAAETRGDLVRAGRTRVMIEDLLTIVRNSMMSLPDFAEMEFGLSPTEVDKLQRRCDEVLMQMAVRAREDIVSISASVTALAQPEAQVEG